MLWDCMRGTITSGYTSEWRPVLSPVTPRMEARTLVPVIPRMEPWCRLYLGMEACTFCRLHPGMEARVFFRLNLGIEARRYFHNLIQLNMEAFTSIFGVAEYASHHGGRERRAFG